MDPSLMPKRLVEEATICIGVWSTRLRADRGGAHLDRPLTYHEVLDDLFREEHPAVQVYQAIGLLEASLHGL